jgi:SAM-dependent methyltransferase
MNLEEYEVMYRQERDYWWFVSRSELLHFCMHEMVRLPAGGRILDLGCGTGANLTVLAEYGQAYGADFSRAALAFCRKRDLPRLLLGDGQRLPIAPASLDLVTSMDSLEHIPDDNAAIAECFRILKPGGRMLITVPAFGFLWSEHDEALQHLRRYTAAELTAKLRLAGFKVARMSHVMFFLFLPVLAMRLIQNFTKSSTHPRTSITALPPLADTLLLWINRLETWLLNWVNFPLGVTIVAVAEKPR